MVIHASFIDGLRRRARIATIFVEIKKHLRHNRTKEWISCHVARPVTVTKRITDIVPTWFARRRGEYLRRKRERFLSVFLRLERSIYASNPDRDDSFAHTARRIWILRVTYL